MYSYRTLLALLAFMFIALSPMLSSPLSADRVGRGNVDVRGWEGNRGDWRGDRGGYNRWNSNQGTNSYNNTNPYYYGNDNYYYNPYPSNYNYEKNYNPSSNPYWFGDTPY